MWKFLLQIMILSALAGTAGCGYFSQFENVEKARALRVGMTKDQVRELLGDPVEDLEDSSPDLWFYYVVTRWHDGLTTEDECMPVVFRSDAVVGWGNQFYNQYRLVEKNLYQPENYEIVE